jgi:hypothetical protein
MCKFFFLGFTMKRTVYAICVSFAAGALSFGAHAQGAENFQFLVRAEKGLQLSIAGFDSQGKRTFQQMSTKRVNYRGKSHYSVLVERDVVFSGFAYWCVQDASEKWLLPAEYGKQPGEAMCDRQPRDDGKGTYVFKVR